MSTRQIIENFDFEGKRYEVRMRETEDQIIVRAYHDNKVANRFSYCIDKETDFDFKVTHGRSALNELIQHVKSDITNRLEELLKDQSL